MAAQGESKSSEKIIPTSAVGTLGLPMGHLDIIECKGGEYLRELSPSSHRDYKSFNGNSRVRCR